MSRRLPPLAARRLLAAALVTVALGAAACSSSGDDAGDPTTTTAAKATTTTADGSTTTTERSTTTTTEAATTTTAGTDVVTTTTEGRRGPGPGPGPDADSALAGVEAFMAAFTSADADALCPLIHPTHTATLELPGGCETAIGGTDPAEFDVDYAIEGEDDRCEIGPEHPAGAVGILVVVDGDDSCVYAAPDGATWKVADIRSGTEVGEQPDGTPAPR